MTSKKRILHVYRTYFPDPVGGVQEVIRQTALSTQDYGCESKIFVLSPSPEPQILYYPEAEIVRAKSWAAPASCDLGSISSYKLFIELANWSDVIQLHFPWPFADILYLLSRIRKPAILSYHSDIIRQNFLGQLYNPLMLKTFSSVDAVVAASPTYAKSSAILSKYMPEEKLRIIPYGIRDYKDVKIDPEKETSTLKKYNLEGQEYTLTVCALRYYKGIHTLIDAAKRIPAKIVIAGTGSQEKALKEQIILSGVTNIIMTGFIDDEEKAILLRNCQLFVLPSHLRSEAFGMVLVEASMFGKPMVCCEINSGPSYINLHGKTGLTVPPEAPHQLANSVKHILTNKTIAKKFGDSARQRYEENFSSRPFGKAYADLYNEVTERR